MRSALTPPTADRTACAQRLTRCRADDQTPDAGAGLAVLPSSPALFLLRYCTPNACRRVPSHVPQRVAAETEALLRRRSPRRRCRLRATVALAGPQQAPGGGREGALRRQRHAITHPAVTARADKGTQHEEGVPARPGHSAPASGPASHLARCTGAAQACCRVCLN